MKVILTKEYLNLVDNLTLITNSHTLIPLIIINHNHTHSTNNLTKDINNRIQCHKSQCPLPHNRNKHGRHQMWLK